MATTKKAKPANKKAGCVCGEPRSTATGPSLLMGAGRTVEMSEEDRAFRKEMNRLHISTMTADLRLHNAHADLAEMQAARAHAELQDYLAQRTKKQACR